ncbi:pilus assembly protein Flp/PilA [Bacillus mesophilus]|uniref:Flp family type IVb pilin n=1 Tax=Bacillus mesophilus TaxID=1808955 RepID=A0A6M0Q7N8_9BACI|nr:Flp family type IVb pilin [Bacillus mesophilus]MBM7661639.1 pilus assembly protein Flp/PilA [Bacillus mesophilus]NEY72307.1 Flp family type IVb pilin [Bacillus mesophilus]
MKEMLKRLVVEEEGATMVEYGLIVALIAVVAAVGAGFLGEKVNGLFNKVGTQLSK